MPPRWPVTRWSLSGRTIRREDGQKNGWQKHASKFRPSAEIRTLRSAAIVLLIRWPIGSDRAKANRRFRNDRCRDESADPERRGPADPIEVRWDWSQITTPITRAASVIRIPIRTWPPPRVHRIVISDRSGSGMAGSGRCAYRSGRPRTTVILPDAGWQASRKFGFREAGLDTAAVSGDATAGGRCPAGRSDARMGRKMDGRNMHRSFGRRRKFGTRDRPPSFCRFADLLDRIARNRTGVFRMIGAETNPPIWNVEAPQISSRRGGPESNNDPIQPAAAKTACHHDRPDPPLGCNRLLASLDAGQRSPCVLSSPRLMASINRS
jgi:hypothetical protein